MWWVWQRSRVPGWLWDLYPDRFSRHDWASPDPEVLNSHSVLTEVWAGGWARGFLLTLPTAVTLSLRNRDLKPSTYSWKEYKSLSVLVKNVWEFSWLVFFIMRDNLQQQKKVLINSCVVIPSVPISNIPFKIFQAWGHHRCLNQEHVTCYTKSKWWRKKA